MNDDLPPDSERLRTLRTWHAMWVDRIDRALAVAEQREAAEAQRRRDQAPPPPRWVIVPDKVRPVLHAGDCTHVTKDARPFTEEQALLALQQDVVSCPDCRPAVLLGYQG
ncbi:DUF6233 domain-containing protein [Streptomyces sp. NPDC048674]|uniref:DUF6233 domain-containing protein n=1 Tax=Streptomyces sp. NPDC048674 TaxID=3155491 RepID=UPI0034231EC9